MAADHGENFAGFGVSDEGGTVADFETFLASDFGGKGSLGVVLQVKIERGGDFETTLFDGLFAVFFDQKIFYIGDEMRSINGTDSAFENEVLLFC